MMDPRLDSVHLEGTRREHFRLARAQFLDARGWATIENEQHRPLQLSNYDDTAFPDDMIDRADSDFLLIHRRSMVYPLKVGMNTLGRKRNNDVVLKQRYISRRHCGILIHTNHRFELHDLSSRNGTYHNNAKIHSPVILYPGDTIGLCDQNFVFFVRNDDSANTI